PGRSAPYLAAVPSRGLLCRHYKPVGLGRGRHRLQKSVGDNCTHHHEREDEQIVSNARWENWSVRAKWSPRAAGRSVLGIGFRYEYISRFPVGDARVSKDVHGRYRFSDCSAPAVLV